MLVFVVIMLFTMLFAMPKPAHAVNVSFAGLGTTFTIDAGTMTVLYDDAAVRLSTGIITDNLNAEIAARIAADAAIAVDTTAISNVKLSTTGGSMSGTLTMANAGIVMTGASASIVTSSDVAAAKFIGSGAGLTAGSVPAASIAAGSLGASVVASSIAANTVLPSKVAAGTYTTITLPAANVAAGSLGANVIASSVAVGSVQDEAIVAVSGSKVTDGVAAANIAAGSLPADVIVSSYALASIPDDALAGSIAPAKITGTAAILGANTFTGAQAVQNTVTVSTAATSVDSLCFVGAVDSLPITGYGRGCLAYLTSDPTKLYISTEAVVGAESWLGK